jgi:hypothetical protein
MEPTKPGYKTTEFWFTIIASAVLSIFTTLDTTIDSLGLPPWAVAMYKMVGPLISAWLANRYAVNRSALKAKAAAQIQTADQAAAALSQPPAP